MHAAIEPAFATRYARCVAKASTSKKAIYLATEAIQRALGDELRARGMLPPERLDGGGQ